MRTVESYKSVREMTQSWRQAGESIGFVPTMGALHKGHLALVEFSKRNCNRTLVSIFVNPTQFNDPKDFSAYPITLEKDLQLLSGAGVDGVWLPQKQEMYSDDYRFRLQETQESKELCGAFRPGHFDGVLTVVMKLLMVTMPTKAFFGEKDFQQLKLISDMAQTFLMPIEIQSFPTVREDDGLAMSSRNVRLSTSARKLAPLFYKTLKSAASTKEAAEELTQNGFRVEYIDEKWGRRLAAVWLENVRLIDNVTI